MNISVVDGDKLHTCLTEQTSSSLDFVWLVTGAFDLSDSATMQTYLREAERVLKKGGTLLVQGTPQILPVLGVFIEKLLTFKYWFAIESTTKETTGLPTVHAGVMMFTKGTGQFKINQVRLPHQHCTACQRTLKDWGGKAHLMNPKGYVISDVIKDLPSADNYQQLSKPVFDLFIEMLDFQPKKRGGQLVEADSPEICGLIAPKERLAWESSSLAETKTQYTLPTFPQPTPVTSPKPKPSVTVTQLYDVVHEGDAIQILRQYPDESIDLVFADPPYNLDKNYTTYEDGQADQTYLDWCEGWLTEYIRILKPTGTLFLLNLPRWAIHQADFLNRYLYFQNWIVWDALSEPRGKIMPAHYALLFYSKKKTDFPFNYEAVSPIPARHYCLRASCIRQRSKKGDQKTTPLNDIWWDVHRIKHRRDRDYHPCQLPESLMERIIRLTTNPGDVVLDAFGGTGTTPLAALKLGRRYVAIDIDPNYVQIMRDKIKKFQSDGQIERQSIKQASRKITKKSLQLELRQLSRDLGRLPTPEDIATNSQYDLDLYLENF